MRLLIQFTILSIIFMNSILMIKRDNYLIIRNNYLKKYFLVKNPILKKTMNHITNRINNIYYKYLNIYHNLSLYYYILSEEDWLLLDGLVQII